MLVHSSHLSFLSTYLPPTTHHPHIQQYGINLPNARSVHPLSLPRLSRTRKRIPTREEKGQRQKLAHYTSPSEAYTDPSSFPPSLLHSRRPPSPTLPYPPRTAPSGPCNQIKSQSANTACLTARLQHAKPTSILLTQSIKAKSKIPTLHCGGQTELIRRC